MLSLITLKKLVRGLRTGATKTRRQYDKRCRPSLQLLEDRTVPATLTVTTPFDVVDATDGLLSLREAIIRANASPGAERIELPAGTYRLALAGADENAAATGDLDISDNMRLVGAGAGLTIVDAAGLDRAFEILPGADASLTGITLRNGNASVGGGVLNNGKLTMDACTVADNVAEYLGGGIGNLGGSLTISNCTIASNTVFGTGALSWGGGGIFNDYQLAIHRATFLGNSVLSSRNESWGGGAIMTLSNNVSLFDSAFIGNTSNTLGGAISVVAYGGPSSDLTVKNSTFADNRAVWGGGATYVGYDYYSTTADLVGCTFTGNSARDQGGAIYSEGNLTMNDCLVTNNSAGAGGGIAALGLTLRDCTIIGNRATTGFGADVATSANAFIVNCVIGDLYQ